MVDTEKDPTVLASYLVRITMRGQEGTPVPTNDQLETSLKELLEAGSAVNASVNSERLDK